MGRLKEDINVKDLVHRFFEGNDVERALIIAGKLENLAENIKNQGGISKHQIRKYYHSLLEITQEVKVSQKLEDKLIKVALLKAYLSYDSKRSQNKINNRLFINFVNSLVSEILKRKDEKTLELAKTLFEALVGYTANLKK